MASEMIYLDNDKRSVTVKTKPLWLDLGGIAKGYAVEKMRQLLSEWDISNFLISGGKSSVYANGSCDNNEGWVVAIFDPYDNHSLKRRLTLNNKSVGSSGTEKGGHIFDPITRKITNNKRFAWVTGPDAVMTECFSTAAIILGREQTEELLEMFPGSECLIL
jgi:thiamine biosynthesis lipoprotein